MTAAESASAATESTPLEGKYVYCIIRNDRSREFGEIGIGSGARVYTVSLKDLSAVVSDTPIVIYDPTRENVLAHEFVNETVMREFTLIPMSFGTIFRSENDVRSLLNSTYQAFTDVLDKMQDKIEFGLKILWDRDSVVAAIERDNDEIRRLKDEITRNAASSTYFARMQSLGRQPQQQGHRRPDDTERRFPRGAQGREIIRRKSEGHQSAVRGASHLQVHRTVAAVQFREHQAEAGKSDLTRG